MSSPIGARPVAKENYTRNNVDEISKVDERIIKLIERINAQRELSPEMQKVTVAVILGQHQEIKALEQENKVLEQEIKALKNELELEIKQRKSLFEDLDSREKQLYETSKTRKKLETVIDVSSRAVLCASVIVISCKVAYELTDLAIRTHQIVSPILLLMI